MSRLTDDNSPGTPKQAPASSPTTRAGRHRIESVFVGVFLTLCAVFAPIYTEFFPFSTCPMFAAHYEQRRDFALFDRDGKKLRNETFSLHSNWNWYLERFYGAVYPPSIVNPTYAAPDMEKVTRHVQAVGMRERARFPLKLEVRTWGSVDSNCVGVVNRDEYIIDVPR